MRLNTIYTRALNRHRGWALGTLGLLAASICVAADAPVPSAPARLAATSLLTAAAVSPTGQLLAVGERGHVLVSRDGGAHWAQASVPVDALLTGACFVNDHDAYVVGHDETILATTDGGANWHIAHYAPESAQPLLNVTCSASGAVVAVGAYATVARAAQTGAAFTVSEMVATPLQTAKRAARMDDDAELEQPHLNAIAQTAAGVLYVAGEAGHLYRSEDGGAHWTSLPSPYSGSFFAVLAVGDSTVIATGLRGHIYRSTDRGSHWAPIDAGTDVLLDGATVLADGRVVVVGLAGIVLVSDDQGLTFKRLRMADRKGLAAVIDGPQGPIVVGENGVRRLQLDPRK